MDLTILPVKQPLIEKKISHHPNLPDVNGGACVLDIASPRQGKTTRIINLLMNPNFFADKFDAIYIYSSTITNGDATARFLLDQHGDTIYSEYSDAHLQQIIDYQDSVPKELRPNIAVLFDDFIAFDKLKKSSLCFRIASSYRHHNIKLLYYSTQLYKAVPPVVRQSINYLIMSKNANQKEVLKIGEECGGRFGSVKGFMKLLKEATKRPYSFLYLDLYGIPAKAYSNFDTLIYTGDLHKEPTPLAVEGEELPEGSEDDESDFDDEL